MSVREVLRMGDPRLLAKADPVSRFDTPELDALIGCMRDTMANLNGAGLAAPQIGVSLRVLIFGVHNNPRYPDAEDVSQTVLINPEIEVLEEAIEYGWEGCLSLPGLRGYVPRFRQIRYIGFDEHGARVDREAEGFHARVVQHECDHLDGILYPMRMNDMSRFGFEEILNL
ncbi:MAG: peptide deformylase [Zetaproteobacteria bacterium]|nr:MAG: peptide deformylase [Zetaproteobacteria bacterium]